MHWKRTLRIPPEANLTPAATDILKRLMSDVDTRLGTNGVAEIKSHPFFEGVEWDKIRETEAPWLPELSDELDCKYFDHFDEDENFYPPEEKKPGGRYKKKNLDMNFIGYTCNKDVENQREKLKEALNNCFEEQDDIFMSKEKQLGGMEISGMSASGINANNSDISMITIKEQNFNH
jgi:serine/threonine kinase 38